MKRSIAVCLGLLALAAPASADSPVAVVEDVKGAGLTDIAKWKMKHLEAEYGINVQLIK